MIVTIGRAAAVLAFALTVAACGSDEPSEAEGPLDTRDVPGVGTVLVDEAGNTLYFTDADKPDDPQCTGECLEIWQPAEVADGTALDGAVDGVDSVELPDGTVQLTYEDKPLYTFDLDTEDKPASGHNLTDTFEGVEFTWHAAVVSGDAEQTAPPEGGYGGGY